MKKRQNLCTSFFISDIIERRKCLEKENIMGQGVSLKEIVEKMNLKNLTPDVDLVEKICSGA